MLLLLTVCIFLLLLYVVKKLRYWKNRGIPGPTPLPLVGNIGAGIIGLKSAYEVVADIYRNYEDCPFVGIYRMGEPCLLLRDPEIIKNILIKDFSHFTDNDIFVDKEVDPLLGRNSFVLKGEEWKKARQFMAPNFATGKIKAVFPLAVTVSKNLVKYLEEEEGVILNAKDVFIKYNCDVVALCGFGVEANSFKDPNGQFVTLARNFVTPGSLQGLKLLASLLMPNLINIKFTPKSFDDGVIAVTQETMRYRQENNIRRNDFFDAVSQTLSASPLEVAAHVANLIVDGFETSSTVMTFVLYELASNPDSQKKLRNEVNSVLGKYSGEFSYEAMQEMVYLDACVSETLRLHPPLAQLSKTCTEGYTVESSSSEFRSLSVRMEKGSTIIISLLGLHMDPKYFPSPEKFMPERFMDKSDPHKYVYMPFGNGPRMCIGNRFGLMQIKVGIAQVIKTFEITLNEKTQQPLKYDPFYFILYPKGGVWFNCKKTETL